MKRAFLDRELCEAAERGNAAAVKKLIARGADVNTPGTEGYFPLYAAAWHGDPKTVSVLINAGANIHTADPVA